MITWPSQQTGAHGDCSVGAAVAALCAAVPGADALAQRIGQPPTWQEGLVLRQLRVKRPQRRCHASWLQISRLRPRG